MALTITGAVVGFVLLVYAAAVTAWAIEQQRRATTTAEALDRVTEDARQLRASVSEMKGLASLMDGQVSSMREQMVAMTTRLLDAALPAREDQGEGEEIDSRSDAEYEPPEEIARDWTDPFFGIDRPLVAGLAPGQQIPGIGQDVRDAGGLPDDLYATTHSDDDYEQLADHPMARGFADVGEEMFDAWDADRGGMAR